MTGQRWQRVDDLQASAEGGTDYADATQDADGIVHISVHPAADYKLLFILFKVPTI